MVDHTCCAPGRGGIGERPVPLAIAAGTVDIAQVPVEAGRFLMGTDDKDGIAADGEGPVREVTIDAYSVGVTSVTNQQFTTFVDETGYVTEAERFGSSFVFAAFLPAAIRKVSLRLPGTPWWCGVNGAHWRQPDGPESDLEGRGDHPAVHVSWADGRPTTGPPITTPSRHGIRRGLDPVRTG